jgi:hypothetical protein
MRFSQTAQKNVDRVGERGHSLYGHAEVSVRVLWLEISCAGNQARQDRVLRVCSAGPNSAVTFPRSNLTVY